MTSIRLDRIRIVIAGIGLLVAALVYLDAQRSIAEPSGALPRGQAEAAIARANLASRMETALGDAFGGVWFEPSTAQLHVGVISAASRDLAEAVAAEAGLADTVTSTPVRSTWDQLVAAQEQLNRRLADLFSRAEAATAIAPDLNTVRVELGSSVSPARRLSLEREAATADVSVAISTLSYPHQRIRPLARCKKFEAGKAYCDPSIVAGTTIVHEEGVTRCTAGPAAMPNDATKPTDTYVLTAGHCIESTGANDQWYGHPKAGGEGKWIGPAHKHEDNKMDIGAIKVSNPGFWVNNGLTPVDPTIAQWSAAAESEPEPVKKQEKPVKGVKTCYSGQTSGTTCGGTIKDVNKTIAGVEKLVEVEGIHAESGDSGAPFFTEAEKSQAEGVLVGEVEGTEIIIFHSLEDSFAKLKELGADLKLLTESNKARHFKFEAESAPVTLTGKKDVAGLSLGTTAGTLQCMEATHNGSMAAKASAEIELTPVYLGCNLMGVPATVDVNGCKYRFTVKNIVGVNREGTMDIVCPEGKTITITAIAGGTPKCTIHVPSQNDLGTVTYTNVGAGATREITVDLGLAGIKYTHTAGAGPGACMFGGAENGTLSGPISITGENGSGAHVGVFAS